MREKIAAGLATRFPNGRKRGGKNRSLEQRDADAREAEGRRNLRLAHIRDNADDKARKQARRQQRAEAAELQRRHDAFQAGQPWEATAGESVHGDAHNSPGADVPAALDALFDLALPELMAIGFVPTKDQLDALARGCREFVRIVSTDPLRLDYAAVAATYHRLVRCEKTFGRPEGKAERLARLDSAFADFGRFWAGQRAIATIKAGVARGERMRGSPAVDDGFGRPHFAPLRTT